MNKTLDFLRLPLLGWTVQKKAFGLLICIHVFNPLCFVTKETMANAFECIVQPTKLNTDVFTKSIFRGKFIFSFWYLPNLLSQSFSFLGFLSSIQNIWHNVSNCEQGRLLQIFFQLSSIFANFVLRLAMS